MATQTQSSVSTRCLVRKAKEFHGHLGPFLAIGVRMGQIGLSELGPGEHTDSLRVLLKVSPSVPYSCVVDGLQISTKCTVGNQRLHIENAEKIEAKFKDLNKGQSVTVSPQPAVLAMLKEQTIGKSLSEKKLSQLAWTIASMPEKDLCAVKKE
jgi:formylmethanofuran dehydrogenase subunit E